MTNLDKLFAFNNLLHGFRKIERSIFVTGSDRQENDAEHCCMLALMAWYIVETHKLDLDLSKVFMYALSHDLVETYAGDTSLHNQIDQSGQDDKEVREKAAMLRLKQEFPEFEILHTAMEGYNNRVDEESKFVYALDKVQPILNIYSDNGRTWKKHGTTIDIIREVKSKKASLNPTTQKYFNELMEILERDKERLF